MKINLPVNDVETILPEGEFIYSRTDLKGVIVEANEAFARISGFTPEEMVGQSHNLVRHPDIPPEAFADLWRDIKEGRPWRGIVKNRRKDGGFYWVVANVSPVREDGRIVGYQSVRGRPTREEIARRGGRLPPHPRGRQVDPRRTRPRRRQPLRCRCRADFPAHPTRPGRAGRPAAGAAAARPVRRPRRAGRGRHGPGRNLRPVCPVLPRRAGAPPDARSRGDRDNGSTSSCVPETCARDSRPRAGTPSARSAGGPTASSQACRPCCRG
jgi:PAS domain S-box